MRSPIPRNPNSRPNLVGMQGKRLSVMEWDTDVEVVDGGGVAQSVGQGQGDKRSRRGGSWTPRLSSRPRPRGQLSPEQPACR